MSTIDERSNAAAEAFADRLNRYPIEEQISVGVISANVLNGCSWSFVAENSDIRNNLEAFKNSKTCSAQKVCFDERTRKYGYLISMRLDYLLGILQRDAPGLIEVKDLQRASAHHQEARVKMSKLLSDRSKPYRGRIGILCTNDSPTITVQGKTYPAFSVTLKEALQLCVTNGYGIQVQERIYDPNTVYSKANSFLENSIVAPSRNAIFINIAPMTR